MQAILSSASFDFHRLLEHMTAATQVICTLFEGSYHLGVAVLANSLARVGFSGTLYAGYRGPLPPWANASCSSISMPPWNSAHTLSVTPSMNLIFVRLETAYHFSNYKPDFMLELMQHAAPEADAIFYFDPDITVLAPWSFFEEWVQCGIAVAEDINSPYSQFHPRRVAWRKYFGNLGSTLTFKGCEYANSGFIGVLRQQIFFLQQWQHFQEMMAPAIGGLERSIFRDSLMSRELLSNYFHFNRPDQDAMNAALEAAAFPSFLPKSAMGFASGETALPHAIGSRKPWRKSYLRDSLLHGRPPTAADKAYWAHADGPLQVYDARAVRLKRLMLKACAALSRFYRQAGVT